MSDEGLTQQTPDIVYDALFRPAVGYDNPVFNDDSGDPPCKHTSAKTVTEAEENENSEDVSREFKPPDGGYGWVIVLGCFISHLISGGFDRSDGVYFLHFRSRYGLNAQLTAWPGAVVSTLRFILGPAASAICNRYSVRTAVMLGAIVFSVGVLLNGFASNFYFLFFSYGLLQGVGRGLFSGPALVIVNKYFDEHRGIAAGLGTSGVGVGTFVIVPLTQYLFESYGYQGTFIILSAIALHMVLVAMLYRPLSLQKLFEKKPDLKCDAKDLTITVIGDGSKQIKYASIESDNKRMRAVDELAPGPFPHSIKRGSSECPLLNLPDKDSSQEFILETIRKRSTKRTSIDSKRGSISSTFAILFPVERQDGTSKPSDKKLFHFHLLRNPMFLLFCISIMLFTMAFKAAFTFMPAVAESRGVSETDAAIILSISGAIDTVGRIAAGVILGLPRLKPFRPLLFNGLIFAIAGISFIVPFLHDFYSFCLVCGLYGMCTGAYVSQKSVVLGDMLGTESIASSFGLLICFQGFGTLVGSPLSGALRDLFGNYDGAFYLGGASMVVAGTVMGVSNGLLRRHKLMHSEPR